ncbi:TIGR02678 family protein [Actinokineospora enzanensis]|uniref:TIGR02678 family protein n=1 Tax=Actinokineospora enzanensis TaxID=155975 RepID=UPI0003655877|nr:TIGR02678 family protein [Actinokineospora enzanensis]
MSTLNNVQAAREREEVAKAIRLLLAAPLVTERADAEAFDVVRRRHEPVARWFDYYCGWSLRVEPRLGYARLVKVGTRADPTRPARRDRSGRAPFDRRRYSLLCVIAAELLTVPLTTIGLLADRVVQATAADPALPNLDTAARPERRAFADALTLLERLGAVEVLDGATEAYVDSTEAKVLYRVDAALLMRLLAAPVGPSQVAVEPNQVPLRFESLLTSISAERRYGTEAIPVSDTQRNLWFRHSVFRILVDDPVLYFDELTTEQRAYLASPTGRRLLRQAAEQGGFTLEERADGIMFVDPDGIATDTRFPDDSGTAKVAALLLLDAITAAGSTTAERLARAAAEALRGHPGWAKAYQGEEGPATLVRDALAVLVAFDLVSHRDGLVSAKPAAYRYELTATKDAAKAGSEE